MNTLLAAIGFCLVLAPNLFAGADHERGKRVSRAGLVSSSPETGHASVATQEPREPEVIFRQLCAVCHGKEAEGDGPAARSMVPKPADLTDEERIGDLSDEELVAVLTKGRAAMPSFESVLQPAEIRAMVDYIRRLSGTEGDDKPGGTP